MSREFFLAHPVSGEEGEEGWSVLSFFFPQEFSDRFEFQHFRHLQQTESKGAGNVHSKFLDNSSGIGAFNDGSSFTINSSDASTFAVRQLYLFCSTNALANHSGTLTIEGKVGPTTVFTITKSAGFSNVATFSPNNGFTLIDFATEGAADYSDTAINQLVISSTGNLDYMALDAFQWAAPTLSVGTVNVNNGPVKLYPNPATTYVKIKNLRGTTSYTIFDVLGKAVQKGTLQQDEAIFINKLNVGLYMVKLDSGQSFKLIKN